MTLRIKLGENGILKSDDFILNDHDSLLKAFKYLLQLLLEVLDSLDLHLRVVSLYQDINVQII
jgi:hypothetical protein